MKLLSIGALVVVTTFVLAACSQSATTNVLPDNSFSASGSTGPATSVSHFTSSEPGKALVSIVIPWPKHSVKTQMHPRFVSPSTMSIVISATSASGGKMITAVANSTGAPAAHITFEAPVGTDRFVAQLWDQHQKAGHAPIGQELGEGVVTQKIVPDKTNAVSFVIDGIVAKIGVALAANSLPALVNGTPGNQALTLFAGFSGTIVLTPLDADGNTIVAPGVVPTMSLTVGPESTNGVGVSPVATNTFAVTLKTISINGTFGLIATTTGGEGVSVTQSLPVVVSTLGPYVGYGSGSGSKIVLYDPAGDVIGLPKNAFSGVSNPIGLAFDSDDLRLFVADGDGKLLAFDELGNPDPSFPTQTVPGITSVTYLNATYGGGNYAPYPPAHQKRVIVGGTSSVAELDATTGQQLVRASLPFTPTAVVGMADYTDDVYAPPSCGSDSWSGWDVLVGDPSGPSLDPYDLVTLTALPPTYYLFYCDPPAINSVLGLNGDAPHAVVGTPNIGSYSASLGENFYSGPAWCANGTGIGTMSYGQSCVYVLSGSTSHIDRLAGGESWPFDQAASSPSATPTAPPNITFARDTESGTLVAAAFNPVNFQMYVVQGDKNAITAFAVADYCNNNSKSPAFQKCFFRLKSKGTIATPASTGLSNPESIAFPGIQGPQGSASVRHRIGR